MRSGLLSPTVVCKLVSVNRLITPTVVCKLVSVNRLITPTVRCKLVSVSRLITPTVMCKLVSVSRLITPTVTCKLVSVNRLITFLQVRNTIQLFCQGTNAQGLCHGAKQTHSHIDISHKMKNIATTVKTLK